VNWQRLHDEIYYCDGSWRDIYVNETTEDDWRKWINFVNDNYPVEFYNGLREITANQIDFNAVLDYWRGKTNHGNHATIIVNSIKLNCHFFQITNIENDLDPKEIVYVTDHEIVLKYMTEVSKLLRKTVVLTPENSPDQPYISVINGVQVI
jgi:hypothetical protein